MSNDLEDRLADRLQATYRVTLPSFEGPLDLLLHLVQKHELSIIDLPVSFITEKYLEYISLMQVFQIDIASEYLVMAATLAYLKSKSMLPPDPRAQDEPDLEVDPGDIREALIKRLLEYQKFKAAAAALGERPIEGRDVFTRQVASVLPTEAAPLAEVSIFRLLEALQAALKSAKVHVAHEVQANRITITERINELCDVLRTRRSLQLTDLFTAESTRFDIVITFLAILEMTRLRMTKVTQLEPYAPIQIELTVVDDAEMDEAIKRLPS